MRVIEQLLDMAFGVIYALFIIMAYAFCFTDTSLGGWGPFAFLVALPAGAYGMGRASR
jgi:hypothetical protein